MIAHRTMHGNDSACANDYRAAVLMLTREQMIQTWQREQAYNAARGLSHYDTLRDPTTGAIVATRDGADCA